MNGKGVNRKGEGFNIKHTIRGNNGGFNIRKVE
jgi:hypothetical protein